MKECVRMAWHGCGDVRRKHQAASDNHGDGKRLHHFPKAGTGGRDGGGNTSDMGGRK